MGINLQRVTCPQEGPPSPMAHPGRLPDEPARYLPAGPLADGALHPGHIPRAWKGASGAEAGTRLAPSRERPGCFTRVGEPSVTSESLTGPPGPAREWQAGVRRGGVRCASHELPAPRKQAGRLSVCGRSQTRPAATGGLFGPGAE